MLSYTLTNSHSQQSDPGPKGRLVLIAYNNEIISFPYKIGIIL